MWMIWLCLTAGAATPGDRAVKLASRLVTEVGPRPARSEAAEQAQRWVETELRLAGWTPERVSGGVPEGTVLACRAGEVDETLLLLAHTDSVHERCPGAIDNAAAVGALLIVARRVPPVPRRTVCLGFPGGEELGLLGSDALAASGRLQHLDQVIALDLVGRGELTWNGLGPQWDERGLRSLLKAAPAAVPWVYRALSHGAPWMERSDHRPFTDRGVASAHLLSRDRYGIYWRYHTAQDDLSQLDSFALGRVVRALQGVVAMEPLGPMSPGSPAIVVPWTTLVLPGWLSWLVLAGAAAAAAATGWMSRMKERGEAGLAMQSGLSIGAGGLMATAAVFAAVSVSQVGGELGGARALPSIVAAWSAWFAVALAWPWRGTPAAAATMGTGLSMGLCCGALWAGLPLLAFPVAVAAFGFAATAGRAAMWPLAVVLCAWAPGYLLRPNALRELDFHHLIVSGPGTWAALWLVLAAPLWCALFLAKAPEQRWPWLTAASVGVCAAVWALSTDSWAAPFASREMLWPPR